MTPKDLLGRLEAEGTSASLKLRLDGTPPSPETLELLRAHRDDLILFMAVARGDAPQMCRLSEEKASGAVWCQLCWRYHLNACKPTGRLYEARVGF